MSRSTATTAPDPKAATTLRRRSTVFVAALALAALIFGGVAALDRAVRRAAANLVPPPASTLVVDRNGRLLRAFATPAGRWSLPVSATDVDPHFTTLLLAVEDGRFAEHRGVDPRAVLRAAAQWAWNRRIASGASTLSMQVARLIAPRPRSLKAKASQAIRALALERRFGKPAILDLYLRLAPYGGDIQGVRAASLAWFGHEPGRLTLAESALLVALPQAPGHRRPDRFAARARAARDRVLDRAATLGLASALEVAAAKAEPVPEHRKPLPALAFHAAGEARAASPGSVRIRLALDADLQARLEPLVLRLVARFGPAVSGALVVIDNASGEILADIGTADPQSDARAGRIDMARAWRSPGSALKPFIYGMAFEDGIAAPDTVIEDRQTHFGSYSPADFDGAFTGSVTAERALQQSLNLPAVALLDTVGPSRFLARLRDAGAGIALPPAEAPGLAVALGGLGIRLVDLARLYSGLARGGDVPVLVERLEPSEAWTAPGRPITDPPSAWAVGEILRGVAPPSNALSGRIAFKTGTSYGFRDALAVGYSRRFTVAAWLGRPDNAAVPGLVGRQAAAPLLFEAFARLPGPVTVPPRPDNLRSAAPLPPPLRKLAATRDDVELSCRSPSRRSGADCGTVAPALRIAYPPDGATVDLGLADRSGTGSALALKAEGGAPPFTWFINGVVAGVASPRRETRWMPDGAGFAHLSVLDAAGHQASAAVRLH